MTWMIYDDLGVPPWIRNLHIYNIIIYTLWLFNIAMENGPFIDGLPIIPWLC